MGLPTNLRPHPLNSLDKAFLLQELEGFADGLSADLVVLF